MRDGMFTGEKLEITYGSREEADAESAKWIAYKCAALGLRVTGEVEYTDTEYGNVDVSVAAEWTNVGALRAAMAEYADAGRGVPQAALDEAIRADAIEDAKRAALAAGGDL